MENKTMNITPNTRRMGIVLSVIALLLIPFIAMQFTKEVNWSAFDFVVAGVLLFGTATVCELVLTFMKNRTYRLLLILVVLAGLFLIWAELAVGVFGTRFAGN
jgi:peptidoglycan/LPS O-acetylase OafA/YrhL